MEWLQIAMGATIAVTVVKTQWARLLTPLPPSGIGEIVNATGIDLSRGPSRGRRDDLSLGGSPELTPHRPWG